MFQIKPIENSIESDVLKEDNEIDSELIDEISSKNLVIENGNQNRKFLKFVVTQQEDNKLLHKKKIKRVKMCDSDNSNGRWTKEEHERFIDAIILFGNDWKKVQNHINSRTSTQARSHAQKFLMKLRNSEFIKKKNINLLLSWSKAITLIKSKLNEEELRTALNSVTNCFDTMPNKTKTKKLKRISKNKTKEVFEANQSLNDVNDIISFSEETTSNFDNDNIELNEENFLSNNKNNEQDYYDSLSKNISTKKDCVKEFIMNFGRKKSYFDLDRDYTNNELHNYYSLTDKYDDIYKEETLEDSTCNTNEQVKFYMN